MAGRDEGSPVFGPVVYELKLPDAIRMGLVVPYEVLVMDIRDAEL